MNRKALEPALEALATEVRALRATDEQVAAALAASRGRGPRRRRSALAGLALLATAAIAVPAATGALDAPLEEFFGGGDPPGTPLADSELPPWLKDRKNGPQNPALVARAGEYRLITYVDTDGYFCFAYANAVIECASGDSWGETLGQEPVILRGPVPQRDGGAILFGFTAGNVDWVEVRYSTGPPAGASAKHGGFVVPLDPEREPLELVALTAGDEVVGSALPDVGSYSPEAGPYSAEE